MNASSRPTIARAGQLFAGALFTVAVIIQAPTGANAQSYVPDGKSIPLVSTDAGSSNPVSAPALSNPVITPASAPASAPVPAAAPAVDPGDGSVSTSAVVKGVTLQATDPAFTGANTVVLASLGALTLAGGLVLRLAARKRV